MRSLIFIGLILLYPLPAYAQNLHILDGDSFIFKGQEIRLWGIDAFEGGQECIKNGIAYPCGDWARAALIDFTKQKKLDCKAMNIDQYGRAVSRCSVEGKDLGAIMVKSGYALEYRRYSRGFYRQQEQEAKDSGRGVWGYSFEFPWTWRHQHLKNQEK